MTVSKSYGPGLVTQTVRGHSVRVLNAAAYQQFVSEYGDWRAPMTFSLPSCGGFAGLIWVPYYQDADSHSRLSAVLGQSYYRRYAILAIEAPQGGICVAMTPYIEAAAHAQQLHDDVVIVRPPDRWRGRGTLSRLLGGDNALRRTTGRAMRRV